MPQLKNNKTGATWSVPDAAVPFWTLDGAWTLVDDTTAAPRKPRRSRSKASPSSARKGRSTQPSPAPTAGAQDDVPDMGSSTTEPPKE